MVSTVALIYLGASLGYYVGVPKGDHPAADSVDVGFLYDMTAHHDQAVKLSMIQLTNGSNPSAQVFAREIIRSQSFEIALMRIQLEEWGFYPGEPEQEPMAWMGMSIPSTDVMPGMADEAELDAFSKAEGAEADALFLALMSDHHAGGVAMAQAAASRADDAWVAETAETMALNQASEIREMELTREGAGLPSNPVGFVADFGAESSNMEMEMDSGE